MVRAVLLSQSNPVAQTHELSRVVFNDTCGAPVKAELVAVAPLVVVSAPLKPTTVMSPEYLPYARVAVTLTLVTGVAATACQISDVPYVPLLRDRKVQLKLPPVTD